MNMLRSFVIAFSTYSRIPMPRVEWSEASRSRVLWFFPAVGVVVGLFLSGWFWLCEWLSIGRGLFAAGGVVIPLAVTGGIHMDGFCDVCDALASHQSRERKLEIMTDPHIGAFGVLWCCVYLLILFGLWSEISISKDEFLLAALTPVLSRTLSALAVLTLPNARGSGMLAAMTGTDTVKGQIWLSVILILCAFWMGLAGMKGVFVVVAGSLCCLWYCYKAKTEFGGTTGDLAGWFLQICELICLLTLVLVQKLEGVL